MSKPKSTPKTVYIGAVCRECGAPANIPLGTPYFECARCFFNNIVFDIYPVFVQPITGPSLDDAGWAVLSSMEDE